MLRPSEVRCAAAQALGIVVVHLKAAAHPTGAAFETFAVECLTALMQQNLDELAQFGASRGLVAIFLATPEHEQASDQVRKLLGSVTNDHASFGLRLGSATALIQLIREGQVKDLDDCLNMLQQANLKDELVCMSLMSALSRVPPSRHVDILAACHSLLRAEIPSGLVLSTFCSSELSDKVEFCQHWAHQTSHQSSAVRLSAISSIFNMHFLPEDAPLVQTLIQRLKVVCFGHRLHLPSLAFCIKKNGVGRR